MVKLQVGNWVTRMVMSIEKVNRNRYFKIMFLLMVTIIYYKN